MCLDPPQHPGKKTGAEKVPNAAEANRVCVRVHVTEKIIKLCWGQRTDYSSGPHPAC